jgi:hypothetical protein
MKSVYPRTFSPHFFLFILLFFFSLLKAESIENLVFISYGEPISKNFINTRHLEEAAWLITNLADQSILREGRGISLLDLIFDIPGDYRIDFSATEHEHDESGCKHSNLPNSILLTVSTHNIKYFTKDCKLSKELKGGADASGTVLSIPVEINSFNNTKVEVPTSISSVGIEANILGKLDDTQEVLSKGTYSLNFILTGKVLAGTYISFDFEDSNGHIQSYYHIQEIK